MTRVVILKDLSGSIRGYDVTGHSGFGFRGRDIVCAAVSILSINTINAIEHFTKEKMRYRVERNKTRIRLRIDETPTEEAKLLLDAFELGIRTIEQEYSRHVQVEIRRYEK